MSRFAGMEAIARATLYEGYVLWPYRRSALKNQRRWTFGGVYPRAWSEAGHPDDAWRMVTRALVVGESGGDARAEVRVRFLQVVRRELERPTGAGGGEREPVDELVAGGERWLAWEEATEREVRLGEHRLADLARSPVEHEIEIAAARREEPVLGQEDGSGGPPAGWIVRTWNGLHGRVTLSAEPVGLGHEPGLGSVFRIGVTIENRTPFEGDDRPAAVERAFVSTHTLCAAGGAAFVSLADPPSGLAETAAACRAACVGTWPVLAGDVGDRSLLLSSPIILEDHPQIAPESPGDLFDGSEIDQLLVLNVLALTDEERDEMAASDPKAREILERCAALGPEEMRRLHGTLRDSRSSLTGPPASEGEPGP